MSGGRRGLRHGTLHGDHAYVFETITHLAFYSGWPNAIAAVGVAKEVLQEDAQ